MKIESKRIQGLLEAYLKVKKNVLSKKMNPVSCEDRIENPSLGITICHHSASLVMPDGDHGDGFIYPTLTLMIDSYNPRISAQTVTNYLPEVGERSYI